MALPTSTIVLALVTCVPFGLAIKDTINGTGGRPADEYASAADDYDSDAYEHRAKAEEELERAEQARKDEAERVMKDGVKKLFGGNPGTLGEAFDGVRIGAAEDLYQGTKPSAIREAEDATKTKITFGFHDGKLSRLTIEPRYTYDEDELSSQCYLLSETLTSMWSAPEYTSDSVEDGTSWSHWAGESGTRVTYASPENGCAITVESFKKVPSWINTTTESVVPMWALDGQAKALVDHLGASAFSNKDEIRWTADGVGAGVDSTELFAAIKGKRIVTITARVRATLRTHNALVDHLTELYDEPLGSGDSEATYDTTAWRKPKLTVTDQDDNFILVVAGKPLPESTSDEDVE